MSAFRAMPLGVMRADVFRYAAVYHHGGAYADVDTECFRPLESWVRPGCDVVFALEAEREFFCQVRVPPVRSGSCA